MIETCAQNCSCSGWVQPWTNNSCSTLCGDGIKQGQEQCDDSNIISHDGCSSVCLT
jgi:cysteine-rich repeat protein